MVRIAARLKPPLVGAVLLTIVAAISWAERHPRCATASQADNLVARIDVGSHGGIVLTPWDRVYHGPQHFEILRPPVHPDAQDWPRGMVIGRNAPSVDPGIQLWFGSPLANVMSVFLAPWRALASQLGT